MTTDNIYDDFDYNDVAGIDEYISFSYLDPQEHINKFLNIFITTTPNSNLSTVFISFINQRNYLINKKDFEIS